MCSCCVTSAPVIFLGVYHSGSGVPFPVGLYRSGMAASPFPGPPRVPERGLPPRFGPDPCRGTVGLRRGAASGAGPPPAVGPYQGWPGSRGRLSAGGEVLLPSCPFLCLSPVLPVLFGARYAPRLAFDGGLAAMSTEAEGLGLVVSFLPLGVLSFLLGLWRQRGSRRSWVFRWRSFLGVVCSRSRLLLFLLPSPLGEMEGVD